MGDLPTSGSILLRYDDLVTLQHNYLHAIACSSSGFVVWFTGLPCSGKTTLAEHLKEELTTEYLKEKRITDKYVRILDGDVLRKGICANLGFSRTDRDENVRRVALMANELADAGAIVLVALVSPYRVAREGARKIIGEDRFTEVHVDCGINECIKRDTKGMYGKAIAGKLQGFTGVNDPYEMPSMPEVHLFTDVVTVEESINKLLVYLKESGFV